MDDGTILLVVGALLAGGIAVSQLGDRLRVPGLVLVIGLGMALGSDGLGLIHFDDYGLAKSVGVVALAAILFEGGLAAGFPEIRPVLRPALALALVGTTLTAVFAGLAASWLLDLSLLEGLLLGSILAATDGAAIPVLEGVPRSEEFFAIAFFAVLVSTVLQGTTFEALARRLGVTTGEAALPQQARTIPPPPSAI